MRRILARSRWNPVVYVVLALNLPIILLFALNQVNADAELAGEIITEDNEWLAYEGPVLYDTLPAAFTIPDGRAPYFTEVAWTKNPLTYRFINCPPPEQLDCGQAFAAMEASMEAWDDVSGITLNRVDGPADINVLFQYNQETNFFPDGPGGILGLTYFPYPDIGELGGDVALDGTESWYIDNPTNPNFQIHLPSVAMHEFGHSLGLNHSLDFNALMWAEYTGPRGLNADDVAGIQAMYGPPSPDEPQPEAPAPTPTPVPADVIPPVQGVVLTAASQVNLNIRDVPSTLGVAIGLLPANTPVPATGRNAVGDWVFVTFQDIQGWVSAEFIILAGDLATLPVIDGTQAPESPTDTDSVSGGIPVGEVTANSGTNAIRVRTGPSTDFAQVSRLDPGTEVPVIGVNTVGDWLFIEYELGQRGWIAAWTVTIEGDLSTVPVIQ